MDPTVQAVLSVLTLVLTPILSGAVVAYQLSQSHSYWHEQQEYLKRGEDFKLKVDILKRASLLVNRLNDQVSQFHVYVSSRDAALGLARAMKGKDEQAAAYYQSEFEIFRGKAAQAYIEWRTLSFQLSELAAEVTIYFGLPLNALATQFRDKAKLAVERMAGGNALVQAAYAAALETGDAEAAKLKVNEHYFGQAEGLRPVEEGRAFLAELLRLVFEQRPNPSLERTSTGMALGPQG